MALAPITAIAAQAAGATGALGGANALQAASGTAAAQAGQAAGTARPDFGKALTSAIDNLEATTDRADGMAVQAATGDLQDAHDYMIASTEASMATELTMAVRNKAVDAFNEIMRMPV